MNAIFDGSSVRVGREGRALYEQSGYGRMDKEGLRLAPQEALYLLHRQKIAIDGYDFDTLLAEFAQEHNFLRTFLVYRDLRERGYVIQPGPHDYRVFRRGERPGTGESLYSVRVLSERDPVRFATLTDEVITAKNMRKQYVLAVVDDENELTYYEIKFQRLAEACSPSLSLPISEAIQIGKSGMVSVPAQSALENAGFGKRFDDRRLILSPVEILYLMEIGVLNLVKNGETTSSGEYFSTASSADRELAAKTHVYTELRKHGLTPRTGYKFGHHFRVYCSGNVHSDMLVHAIEKETAMPMSLISRSVRMAHSVKKKMLFGCVHTTGIQFVEFARIKL